MHRDGTVAASLFDQRAVCLGSPGDQGRDSGPGNDGQPSHDCADGGRERGSVRFVDDRAAGGSARQPDPFSRCHRDLCAGQLPNLAGVHTCNIAFQDNLGAAQSLTWTFTFRSLQSPALPVGSLSVRGFDARMVQSQAADPANNSVATAEAMLNFPPTYAVDQTTTNITQVVAWDIANPPSHYGAVTNFPGLCLPPTNVNNFAVEVFTYLELSAGAHRLLVDSDDAVAVYTGANLHGHDGADFQEWRDP